MHRRFLTRRKTKAMKRIMYVLPGDTVEIRPCFPAFGPACAATWKEPRDQYKILLEVQGMHEITVYDPMLMVFQKHGMNRRQLLPEKKD